MKKEHVALAALIVCGAGFASAGALAYTLTRPLLVPPKAIVFELAEAPTSELTPARPEPSPVIEVAPVVVIGDRPRLVPAPPPPAHPRSLSEMHCTGWKPLEQGSVGQMVR